MTRAVPLLIGLLAGTTAAAQPSGLTRLLEAEAARFPGRLGVHVKHLATGEEAGVRDIEAFNSASVIKLPIMALAFELADRGALDLSRRVEVAAADLRGGSGVLRLHDHGLNPTARDLVMQMIVSSDNAATDMVLAQVGGVGAVNQWIASCGFTGMRLHRTLYEVFRLRYEAVDASYAALSPEDVYAAQTGAPAAGSSPDLVERLLGDLRRRPMQEEWNRRSNEEPATWLGSMTPRDTGRLLEAIERGTLASEQSTAAMRQILRQQLHGARRLPHFLDVPVGHKTGDIPPIVANDAGIVYARSGPIVLSVFAMQIRGSYAEAEDRIGRLARLVVDYFDGTEPP